MGVPNREGIHAHSRLSPRKRGQESPGTKHLLPESRSQGPSTGPGWPRVPSRDQKLAIPAYRVKPIIGAPTVLASYAGPSTSDRSIGLNT